MSQTAARRISPWNTGAGASRKFNLWSCIDASDAARCARLALESDISGAKAKALPENPDEGREKLDKLMEEAIDAQAYWRPIDELVEVN